MKKLLSILLTFFLVLALVSPILAAGTYYSEFVVGDTSGTARAPVSILVPFGTTQAQSLGFIDDGLDCRVFEGTTQRYYMIADDKIGIVAPTLAASQSRTYRLETGYSPDVTGFGIITGTGGYVTTVDHANLELGSDFDIYLTDIYVDTSVGHVGDNLVLKTGAIRVYISGAGAVTATITGGPASAVGTVSTGEHDIKVSMESR